MVQGTVTVYEARIATVTFLRVSHGEWCEGTLQLACRKIEKGSRETYGSALRRFLDGRNDAAQLADAIDDRL